MTQKAGERPTLARLLTSRRFVVAVLVAALLLAATDLMLSHFVRFPEDRKGLWVNVATGAVETLVGGVVVAILLYAATVAVESTEDARRWQAVERSIVSDVGARLTLHASFLQRTLVAALPAQVRDSVRVAMLDLGDINYAMAEMAALADGVMGMQPPPPVPEAIPEDFYRLYGYLGDVALPLLGDLRRDPEFILSITEMRINIVRYLGLTSGSEGIVGNDAAVWWSTAQLFRQLSTLNDHVSARDTVHADTQQRFAEQITKLQTQHVKEDVNDLFAPKPAAAGTGDRPEDPPI